MTLRGWSRLWSQISPQEVYHSVRSRTCGFRFDEPSSRGCHRPGHDPHPGTIQAGARAVLPGVQFGDVRASPPPQRRDDSLSIPFLLPARRRCTVLDGPGRPYGIFAANGILFNHGSPRRGETFVTRQNQHGARIAAGLRDYLYMGNPTPSVTGATPKEYVEAMWRMPQADEPDDYVIATGTSYTVRDFCRSPSPTWGLDWEKHVQADERYLGPPRSTTWSGTSKATQQLGWKPQSSLPELARLMVDADTLAPQRSVTPARGWSPRSCRPVQASS